MEMRIVVLLATLTLAGCVDVSPAPVVSDYNGRIVKIQDMGGTYSLQGRTAADSPAVALAQETCALDGRKSATYQGFRMVSQYAGEHVFLCR